MKTFLRDLSNGRLYCAPGRWVESWMEATDLGSHDAAHSLGMSLPHEELEVLIVHPDGKPAWGQKIRK